MRVAYCAPEGCGSGHAVRGIALVQAAERYKQKSAPVLYGPASAIRGRVHVNTVRPLVNDYANVATAQGQSPSEYQPSQAVSLRAFGPIVRPNGPLPDLTGYEASPDWRQRVLAWQPDLLIGDLRADLLEPLRRELGVPAWLLMRIWPRPWKEPVGWRVIAIEPGVGLGIRESVPPIVGPQRMWPEDGAEIRAGYASWHEAIWYDYWSRVTWVDGRSEERRRRIEVGPSLAGENGADVLVRQVTGAY